MPYAVCITPCKNMLSCQIKTFEEKILKTLTLYICTWKATGVWVSTMVRGIRFCWCWDAWQL